MNNLFYGGSVPERENVNFNLKELKYHYKRKVTKGALLCGLLNEEIHHCREL